ncbi:MAG: lipopolysaccharide biosynthesis protein [Anaerolineae bacterium]
MIGSDRQLSRGTFYLAAGQAAFLLSGFALYAFLARWLSPSLFGVFRVAMSLLVWVEITVNNGVPAALQRFLPDPSLVEPSVRRSAARCQAILSVGMFGLFFLAAPWLAALLRDPDLTGYLRLAFVDILGMGAYGYYRGILNGKRAFRQLAATIALYALTKLAVSSLLVYAGLGVEGALVGNIASSLGGLAVAFLWSRRWPVPSGPETGQELSERQVWAFVVPAIAFTLSSNLLLGLDLMGVQALLAGSAEVGYYGAAVILADAPRLVLLAFSFTLLPSLSHAIAAQDLAQTRDYLRQVIRLLALATLPVLALVTGMAEPLVTLLFSETYRPTAPILTVLIFSYAAYSVYITLVTALLAENRPGRALTIPTSLLPLAGVLIWLGVSRLGAIGAAFASLVSVSIAALIVIVYVLRRFKPKVNLVSLARIAVASFLLGVVARLWSPSGPISILACGVLGGFYVALLLVLGEVRRQDVIAVMAWFAPPRPPKEEKHGVGEL